jgi:hypothetical protein
MVESTEPANPNLFTNEEKKLSKNQQKKIAKQAKWEQKQIEIKA